MLLSLTFRQRVVLCALGGVLHVLALNHAPPLAWLSLVPAGLALAGQPLKATLLLGLVLGVFDSLEAFGAALYGGAPVVILMACDTSVRLLWALVAGPAWRLGPAAWTLLTALGVPAAERLAEALFSPYYWPLSLADTQAELTPVIQVAAYGGAASLNAFIGLSAALLAQGVAAAVQHQGGRARRLVAAGLAVPALLTGLGAVRLALAPPPERFVKVASIQGGIPTWAYRNARYVPELEDAIDDAYFGQTLALPPGSVDLVAWPETAVRPSVNAIESVQQRLQDTAGRVGATLLVGMPLKSRHGTLLNGVVMATREGIATTSAKQRLVPILEMEWEQSPDIGVFDTPVGRVGVLVCVESAYVDPARQVVERGAELIVVLANDSGFGHSTPGRDHARLGALRAVENGVSVVHAGQFQTSRIFDPYGRVLAAVDQAGRAVLTADVPLPPRREHGALPPALRAQERTDAGP